MSANREGGQGTQKSGQKPGTKDEQDVRTPSQQREEGGQGRQEQKDRPVDRRENR